MRIVYDSNKLHWAIGRHAECPRCETVVEIQTLEDFRAISYNKDKVVYDCPRCKRQQDFHKPPKIKAQFPYSSGGTATVMYSMSDCTHADYSLKS